MKIGVIGHTLHLNTIKDLPPRALSALAKVDLVLHVGNVGRLDILRAFQDRFGITFAVYSPQDPQEVQRYLEPVKVVKFANRRIGIIFGLSDLEQGRKLPVLKRSTITPDSLSEQLLEQFDEEVDCVVFGYPAKTFSHLHNGLLIFNPGQLLDKNGNSGSIGILEITDRVITGRILKV